jgi:cyclopropane fatty-acyl-phospholipid synthase-like methyltransferase
MEFRKDRELLNSDTGHLLKWYDQNALKFRNTVAIERAFVEMTAQEQYRLNHFKLWHLEHGSLVCLQGKRILEFGCGHGRMAITFKGYESYLGIDFCADLVRIGQERLARAGLLDRAQLIVSDCLTFEGPKEYFDVVCSLGMFAFVEDPQAMLRKMCFHLKPGGTIFIDGHYDSPLYRGIRRWRWRREEPSGGISQVFAKSHLHSLFMNSGLPNVRIFMREYPLLGDLYARRGCEWALWLRNELAKRAWLDFLGTDFFAIGNKLS